MKKLLLLAVVLLYFLSLSVYPQISKNDDPKFVRVEKTVQRNGWDVPDLSNEKTKDQDIVQTDGVAVNRTLYLLEKKISYSFDYYYSNQEDKSLKIETYPCDIESIVSYRTNNKTFAYSFNCIPFGITTVKKDGKTYEAKGYIGLMLTFLYFDEDGDGKFETKYITPQMQLHIPEWIKNLK
jgi:hypothetical protein